MGGSWSSHWPPWIAPSWRSTARCSARDSVWSFWRRRKDTILTEEGASGCFARKRGGSMVLVSLSLQFLFGIFFAPEGVIKWTHVGPSTERFQHFRYLRWFQ